MKGVLLSHRAGKSQAIAHAVKAMREAGMQVVVIEKGERPEPPLRFYRPDLNHPTSPKQRGGR